jgi:hypothetical protein
LERSYKLELNSPGSNYKDELAFLTLNLLGIESIQATKDAPQDFATIMWI